jgi:hypothetical protein
MNMNGSYDSKELERERISRDLRSATSIKEHKHYAYH